MGKISRWWFRGSLDVAISLSLLMISIAMQSSVGGCASLVLLLIPVMLFVVPRSILILGKRETPL